MDKSFVMKTDAVETEFLLACLEVGKLLTSNLDIDRVLELIMAKVSQLIPAENWSLLLKEDANDYLKFEVVVGIDKNLVQDIRVPVGNGIAGTVFQTGEPIFLANVENDSRVFREVDNRTGFITHSIICLPLKTHGKVLGVLEIINIEDVEQFRKKYLPVLNLLVDYAAIAIENSQLFRKIQHMSITDEYTGLYNSRYLHEALDKIIGEAGKRGENLSVVFMDIDNFKIVVDAFGHMAGSQVLKEVGQTISECLSDNDILIKYGGDEYILLLPGRNKEEAVQVTEQIHQAIRSSEYLKSEPFPIQLTASFGIATYPEDAQTKKDLLLKADNSMYHIKKTTKDGIGTR